MRYLALRTLLRLAEGIEGDPAVRDYSAMVAAHERHRAQLLGHPIHASPVEAAAALLHAIVRLQPLEARNDIFGSLAAYALLRLNDIAIKATPRQAIELARAVERGELNEQEIAAQLAQLSDQ